jgi:hypothetical protein
MFQCIALFSRKCYHSPQQGRLLRARGLNMQPEVYTQLSPICIALAVRKF